MSGPTLWLAEDPYYPSPVGGEAPIWHRARPTSTEALCGEHRATRWSLDEPTDEFGKLLSAGAST